MIKRTFYPILLSTVLLVGCTEQAEPEAEDQQRNVPAETEQTESDATVLAVEKAEESVVGISNIQQRQGNAQIENVAAGTGSGVIYKKEGENVFIVTNQHVVNGADEIEVTLQDSEKRSAEIVGQDVYTDLAVLRMSGEGIENVIEIGDSSDLKKGETVVAIGNPLGLDFFGTVTKGVVSAKERVIPIDINKDGIQDWQVDVMQTDTPINPGNSGGALVNLQGELVGINSMKISQELIEGIAFVIPIDTALPILEEIETEGEVTRPQLGIGLLNLRDVPEAYKEQYLNVEREMQEGVVVLQVAEGTEAFQRFDIIKAANGEPITNIIEMREFVFNSGIGEEVTFTVLRNGEEIEIPITLSE